ncbi:MAG: sigma-54-dependent Fis family transcriptional regulator [Planctomycetes bacterium]|nr:sigma-54-dependent Fis family transcriptional regulator [Planctomycetota bacterium]
MARILAVDDSEQNLLLIELYLKGEFEVVTATSGRAALDLVARQDFDLVLLDVVLPELNGFEVCQRLKADPRTASIPVVFLSGRMREDADKMQGYEVGAVDYITKPVDRQELVARIRVMLQLREARRQLERTIDRLQGELRLQQSRLEEVGAELEDRRRLDEALEHAPAPAAAVVEPDGRLVAADPGFLARIAPGLTAGQRLAAAAGPAAAWLVEQVAHGREGTQEVRFGDGAAPRRLRLSCRPLAGAGEPRWLLLCADVSESAEARERLAAHAQAEPSQAHGDDVPRYVISNFVGRAPVLHQLFQQVDRLRHGRATVLIYGETGTGKELVARALHFDGPHANRPFIPIHCGAISPELIESELFGYEKGAFTGALNSKEGLFRAADGGTIFLDEIAETAMDLQVKLLRVLQQGEIRPVGAARPLYVDVRILAATNQDLLAMVRAGTFRADLYYRLEVVTLRLPSLRERVEDIALLAEHFIAHFNQLYARSANPVRGLSRGALQVLQRYPWPSNVREFENVLDRAFALGCGTVLREEDLPEHVLRNEPSLAADLAAPPGVPGRPTLLRDTPEESAVVSLRDQRARSERSAIQRALEAHHGDKLAAARSLGLSRSTFYRRLKELGL